MSDKPWLVLEDETSVITRMYRRMAKKGNSHMKQREQHDDKHYEAERTARERQKNQKVTTKTATAGVSSERHNFDEERSGTSVNRSDCDNASSTPDQEIIRDKRWPRTRRDSFCGSLYDIDDSCEFSGGIDDHDSISLHNASTASTVSFKSRRSYQLPENDTAEFRIDSNIASSDSASYVSPIPSYCPDGTSPTASIAEGLRDTAYMDSSSRHYFNFFDHYCSSRDSSTSQVNDTAAPVEAWDGFDFSIGNVPSGRSSMTQNLESKSDAMASEVLEIDSNQVTEAEPKPNLKTKLDIESLRALLVEDEEKVIASRTITLPSRTDASRRDPILALNRGIPEGTTIADMRSVIQRSLTGPAGRPLIQPSQACQMIDLCIPKTRIGANYADTSQGKPTKLRKDDLIMADPCPSQDEEVSHSPQASTRDATNELEHVSTLACDSNQKSTTDISRLSRRFTREICAEPTAATVVEPIEHSDALRQRRGRQRARTSTSQPFVPGVLRKTDETIFEVPKRALPIHKAKVEIVSHSSSLDIVPRLRSKTLDSPVGLPPPVKLNHAVQSYQGQNDPGEEGIGLSSSAPIFADSSQAAPDHGSLSPDSSLEVPPQSVSYSSSSARLTKFGRGRSTQKHTSSLRKKTVTKDTIGKPILVATSADLPCNCVALETRI